MGELLGEESHAARELLTIVAQDSRIGYEPSNHYYYLPGDLLEKIVCCGWQIHHADTERNSK